MHAETSTKTLVTWQCAQDMTQRVQSTRCTASAQAAAEGAKESCHVMEACHLLACIGSLKTLLGMP